MVLSGLHIGNEIWWSDPSGQEGTVNWDTLRIDVAGYGTFGWGEKKSASRSSTNQPASEQVAGKKTAETEFSEIDEWNDEPITVQEEGTSEQADKKKGLLGRLFDSLR